MARKFISILVAGQSSLNCGSGDILAGIIGAQLAQGLGDVTVASALGVTIHGIAGEYLARDRGQIMVRTHWGFGLFAPRIIR